MVAVYAKSDSTLSGVYIICANLKFDFTAWLMMAPCVRPARQRGTESARPGAGGSESERTVGHAAARSRVTL